MPKITIVFPTYNGWKDTQECLNSLLKLDYPKKKLQIIVVDNNSNDGTVQNIKKYFPIVTLIKSPKNLGYSKAINIAARQSKSDYILFANNDIVLDKNYLKEMIALAESNHQIGIVGHLAFLKDNRKKLAFDGLRVNPYLSYHQYDLSDINKIRECDLPPAGGFLARREMLDEIGLLDEGYFLYFEDLDLCLRTKKYGWKVIFNPKAIAYHGFGKTAFRQEFAKIVYEGYKSRFRCLFKNASLFQITTSLIAQFTILIVGQNLKSQMKTYKPMLAGFIWNLKHLRKTRMARKKAYRDARIPNFFFENILSLKLIIILGLAIRLFYLAKSHDFWFDEAFTYQIARLDYKELLTASLADNNPPIYYLLIHEILKISPNELVLRLPSLFAGIATIFFVWQIAKIWQKGQFPSVAALLIAMSPQAIYLSTEARPHAIGILATTVIVYLFSTMKKNFSLTFTAVSSISLLTHYYTAFLFIPLTLIKLFGEEKSLKRWVVTLSIIFAPFLIWMLFSLQVIHTACYCPNTTVALSQTLVSPQIGAIGAQTISDYLEESRFSIIPFATSSIFFIVMLLAGIIKSKFSIIYLLPLVILSLVGFFVDVFSPKAFAIFTPIYFLIISVAIISFKHKAILTTAAISLLIFNIYVVFPTQKSQENQLKPSAHITLTRPQTPVLHTSVFTYYSHIFYTHDKQKNILIGRNPLSQNLINLFGEERYNSLNEKTLWLVDTQKWTFEEQREKTLATIFKNYTLQEKFELAGITIYRLYINEKI